MSDCHVYVLQRGTGGPVKIGISGNAYARARAISTSGPETVSVLYTKTFERKFALLVEKTAHGLLSDKRMAGEWFNASPDEAIRAVDEATVVARDGGFRKTVRRNPREGKPVVLRLTACELQLLDEARRGESEIPTRAEMIRIIIARTAHEVTA